MTALEQGLLYAATTIVLAGTLIVFVVQYIRQYGRKRRGGDRDGRDDRDRRDDG